MAGPLAAATSHCGSAAPEGPKTPDPLATAPTDPAQTHSAAWRAARESHNLMRESFPPDNTNGVKPAVAPTPELVIDDDLWNPDAHVKSEMPPV